VVTHFVNLDALIPREYFEAVGETQRVAAQPPPSLRITDLEPNSFTYPFLRKPEFQRETANWGPAKIVGLILGFLNGDLIPSIILWRSNSGHTFVIDGAHRLSAFIAWVHDDYGDKQISRPFFGDYIPEEQLDAASRTRQLVNSAVGSYHDLQQAARYPQIADPERLRFAQNLGAFSIALQWVIGDASTAERSFFKINQEATPIDQTELAMIKSRHKPNALATRALIRAGTGHKYWSAFPRDVQAEIENIAREVYETLFRPAIDEPLKTLDLPVAGRGYSPDSVKMMFELVNFVNRVPAKVELSDDIDGTRTLAHLKTVRRSASLIAGNELRSLGLHPVIYFYSATGRFQASAFLAVMAFVRELDESDQLRKFTSIRARFEDFLLEHRHFINVIGRRYGAMHRGVPPYLKLYNIIFNSLQEGESTDGILKRIDEHSELRFLLVSADDGQPQKKDFSRGVKNAKFLREAIDSAIKCKICNARMHFKSISVDHVTRRIDGGLGTQENAQLAHPYCNSGYKEALHHETLTRSVKESAP
jgi:hypothetical protein